MYDQPSVNLSWMNSSFLNEEPPKRKKKPLPKVPQRSPSGQFISVGPCWLSTTNNYLTPKPRWSYNESQDLHQPVYDLKKSQSSTSITICEPSQLMKNNDSIKTETELANTANLYDIYQKPSLKDGSSPPHTYDTNDQTDLFLSNQHQLSKLISPTSSIYSHGSRQERSILLRSNTVSTCLSFPMNISPTTPISFWSEDPIYIQTPNLKDEEEEKEKKDESIPLFSLKTTTSLLNLNNMISLPLSPPSSSSSPTHIKSVSLPLLHHQPSLNESLQLLTPPISTITTQSTLSSSSIMIASSLSLTNDIYTFRRMASKTKDHQVQLSYMIYLVQMASLYKHTKKNDLRFKLLREAGYWLNKLYKAKCPLALMVKSRWYMQQHPIHVTFHEKERYFEKDVISLEDLNLMMFLTTSTSSTLSHSTSSKATTNSKYNDDNNLLKKFNTSFTHSSPTLSLASSINPKSSSPLLDTSLHDSTSLYITSNFIDTKKKKLYYEKAKQCLLHIIKLDQASMNNKNKKKSTLQQHLILDAYYFMGILLWKKYSDPTKALPYFRHAAEHNHILACYKLAIMLLYEKSHTDIKQGITFLQKAADMYSLEQDTIPHPSAKPCYLLSYIYSSEESVIGLKRNTDWDNIISIDQKLSKYYLEKAVQLGNVDAMVHMGKIYEKEGHVWEAFQWYLHAIELNQHAFAMLYISKCYERGISGHLDINPLLAFKWCQKACEQGNLDQADYLLGTFYERGFGVSSDYTKALTYYDKAASKGYAPAAELLNRQLKRTSSHDNKCQVKHFSSASDSSLMVVSSKEKHDVCTVM